MTSAEKARARKRSATWRLETVESFAGAEAQTRAHQLGALERFRGFLTKE